MPKGACPTYFFDNPYLEKEKSMEEILNGIQSWTCEIFPDDKPEARTHSTFFVLIPPLNYKGVFLKGTFFSQGVDYIHSLFPRCNELFLSMAYSMWGSIPYSEKADCYLTCYDNPQREFWFKQTYPHKSNKIFIPLEDSDYTNDINIHPMPVEKDIDILCVSVMQNRKNIPMLLKSVMTYHKKYDKLLKTVLITGNRKGFYDEKEQKIIQELEIIAGGKEELDKYIEILNYIPYGEKLCTYYSRAKVDILTSIYEGKNRSIHEANLCNTPVIVFKDFNKYIRGNDKAFPDNAGLYAPEFTPESMADTIHQALNNLDKFTPRESYMKVNGRMNFLNKCIDSIPYYRENIPNYIPGNIEANEWFSEAIFDNYELTPMFFTYSVEKEIQDTRLHERKTAPMDFYYKKFNMS